MISATLSFKYIDRGKQSSIVLIPGWGTDYRIFASLDLNYNYLIPLTFSFFDFEQKLFAAIKENNIEKISLFGWSLGGFLAADFSVKFPELIEELILVGAREKYPSQQLLRIRDLLKRNKKAYLIKFYAQCFSKKENMREFRKNYMKDYLQDFELSFLVNGLDYLEAARIDFESLKRVKKIKIIQGEDDKIVPLAEAVNIKNNLSQAEFILIKDSGHAVFLEQDITKYV